MNEQNEWYKLLERSKNFHESFELLKNIPGETFFAALYDLREKILPDLDKENNLDNKKILTAVFSNIYDYMCMSFSDFTIFHKSTIFYDNVYEACLFTTLAMFLHNTKRINSKTLQKFIYDNSLDYYDQKDSTHYCPFENPSDRLLKATKTLRQNRYRLFSSRPVYNQRSEWSAISKDSEYEWTLMYTLEIEDAILKDTFKRIKNLYTDIYKELRKPKESHNIDNFEKAYKLFLSKLKKIKYENYLELQKVFLSHIYEDKTHYGINLYRFEKENRLYIIMNEIKKLAECSNASDEKNVLFISSILNNIHFPKLYEDFASLSTPSHTWLSSTIFSNFLDYIINLNCLIIDELIEKGYFGENWETFFLDFINEMAENVFYNPEEIYYSIAPGSQENFEKILTEPVRDLLFQTTGKFFD